MSCLTFQASHKAPSHALFPCQPIFQVDAEQNRTGAAYPGTKKMSVPRSNPEWLGMQQSQRQRQRSWLLWLTPHHLEEISAEMMRWSQRSMAARGTTAISRRYSSSHPSCKRTPIASLVRWSCELLAACGQPNEDVCVGQVWEKLFLSSITEMQATPGLVQTW